jgi:hypothetical protein
MGNNEFGNVVAACVILALVMGMPFIYNGHWETFAMVCSFAIIIIATHVLSKKVVAFLLDSDVEHRLWHVYRFGFKGGSHFKKEIPFGVVVPLGVAVFATLLLWPIGAWIYFMGILTYETRALKYRAAKRFGFYSYTEVTDWHNAIIGGAGILAVLILAVVAYFPGLELLTRLAIYYAFFNMLPISELDGTQIFFGSRVLYFVLGVITLILTAYALVLPVA